MAIRKHITRKQLEREIKANHVAWGDVAIYILGAVEGLTNYVNAGFKQINAYINETLTPDLDKKFSIIESRLSALEAKGDNDDNPGD
jgi:hypothetical protein